MIEITRHGTKVIDELRPFWLALVAHHAVAAPVGGLTRRFDRAARWSSSDP